MILGEKWRNRRRNRSENLFFFLEMILILGEKWRNRRRNRSEDLFFLGIAMILGEK